jgi:DNA-3-methyladenine glycosylase
MEKLLKKEFYLQNAEIVAKELLGKYLVREYDNKKIVCKIVETEAYIGPEDKACHAYNNRCTERTKVMFEEGGIAYIYFIYGMYYCLNIVVEREGKPEAVLIRGVEPAENIEEIKSNRSIKSKKEQDLTNGPGKLCTALKIDKSLNGYDVTRKGELYITEGEEIEEIITAKRINIDYAEEYRDKHWRFYIKGNKFVSKE